MDGKTVSKKIKGAYSMAIVSPRKMIGARDPFGFRPLCIGKRDNTCAEGGSGRLERMVNGLHICKGCFTGIYPMEPPKEDIRGEFEQ